MDEPHEGKVVRLSRATYQGHDDVARLGTARIGSVDLVTDHLQIGWNLWDAPMITLSVRSPDDLAYCLEFDITPDDARELAVALNVAATFSEGRPRELPET